ATTNGTTTVTIGAAADFAKNQYIMIPGAGAACSISSTACSSITPATPTLSGGDVTGWNGGTDTYSYEIAACDANYGCTAAGSALNVTDGAPVLSAPGTTATGNYNALTWTATNGASHYAIWRNHNSAGY